MAADVAPDPVWSRLSELIASKTGLHFPAERQADLIRGLAGAAEEFGFDDSAACAEWLLSSDLSRAQLHTLASHLTIGETYFFRDRSTFDALSSRVLPELIARRRRERRLFLWSAACCTGEEAYSLAILLQQCLPDWRDWRITLLATDISERFLEKARAAVYGEWSFRDAPNGLKAGYFTRTHEGRYELLPQVRQMVQFVCFNLVEDSFASLVPDARGIDLILCRNVLMYFTQPQAEKVVRNLHHVMREDGWLVVAASEGSQSLIPRFTPVSFPGAIFHRKASAQARNAVHASPSLSKQPADYVFGAPSLLATTPAPSSTVPAPPAPARKGPAALELEARALANQGKLAEALIWCDRWIAADALDGAARYLRAVVLQELGDRKQARRALQQAIYLQPDFVLAHFALGNLARTEGWAEEGNKHFANALALLRRCAPDDVLPQSDGLTAGRLEEIVMSLLGFKATS